jgi:hypothetical protein
MRQILLPLVTLAAQCALTTAHGVPIVTVLDHHLKVVSEVKAQRFDGTVVPVRDSYSGRLLGTGEVTTRVRELYSDPMPDPDDPAYYGYYSSYAATGSAIGSQSLYLRSDTFTYVEYDWFEEPEFSVLAEVSLDLTFRVDGDGAELGLIGWGAGDHRTTALSFYDLTSGMAYMDFHTPNGQWVEEGLNLMLTGGHTYAIRANLWAGPSRAGDMDNAIEFSIQGAEIRGVPDSASSAVLLALALAVVGFAQRPLGAKR